MGKSLAELGLKASELEDLKINPNDIPNEYIPRTAPLYPGDYQFNTPKDFTYLWDSFEADGVERVQLIFDKEDPLIVAKSFVPEGAEFVGTTFTSRISSKPRNRGKEKIPVSDLIFFIRALSPEMVNKIKNNIDLVNAVNKLGGKPFVAFAEWSANCGAARQAYVETSDGGVAPALAANGQPRMGCGKRVFFSDWPKHNGLYARRIGCVCGAVLNPLPVLSRFRAVK